MVGFYGSQCIIINLKIMGLRNEAVCPLCQDEETSIHFIAKWSATMLLRRSILGDYTLSLDTLNGIHWTVLLRFAKASKRFLRPRSLLGLHIEPKLRPQRWCALCTCPEGKVR